MVLDLKENMKVNENKLKYAKDVVAGNIIACNYIICACKNYLERFNREDIYFNEDKVEKVLNFISKLKHFQGTFANKPFVLEEWQKWIIYNIYGWYWKETNERVTKTVYIECARKQGKSMLCAAIALYALVEEEGSEVDIVANSRQQAKILFDMSSNTIKKIDPNQKVFKTYRDKIKFDLRNSYLQVLSSDASRLDGFSSYLFVEDELHEAPNDKLYSVLKSSQGARTNPLAISITTAGFNLGSFCYQLRQSNIQILLGAKQDDTQFTAIYTQDEDDDLFNDESCWIKSNPNLNVTVKKQYLKEQVQSALNNTSLRVGILTKNFNKWCNSIDVWIPEEIILKKTHKDDYKDYQGSIGYVSVDLAAVSDLTAVSLMLITLEGEYKFWTWYFLPETELQHNVNSDNYRLWLDEGYLNVTAGNVTDYDYILKLILDIRNYINIQGVYYDSWNATQFAINATEQGLNMCPFSQAIGHFNRGTKELERLIKSEKVNIEYNPITLWCFRNVELKTDWSSNQKPVKKGDSMGKIDGVITHIQALGGYMESPHYINEVIPM